MKRALRIAAQLALYVPLMALIGYFSTEPRFFTLAPDQALVRLSFIHAAERKEACRERSAAELAKLAPNMRAALDCPRERAVLLVELEVDGEIVLRREVAPSGVQRDGNATVYHRLPLAAGRHRIVARLRDGPGEEFNFIGETTLELAPGAALLIDFSKAKGGFVFRT
ncbi:MAG: hypothetical protein OEW90_07195 [Betaproteobacteria bacterium]|nr:hypothetical protein [Betaproteobacteria bacterium]MDH4323912.1 hypothetical protein [Betaproteobacteria bacterium]